MAVALGSGLGQVGGHPLGVDDDPLRLVASQSMAAPVAAQHRVERRPLGVPRPGGALELVAAGGVEQRGGQAGHLHRRGAGTDRGDRVVLVGHRRRAAGSVGYARRARRRRWPRAARSEWRRRHDVAARPQAPAMRAIGVRRVDHGRAGDDERRGAAATRRRDRARSAPNDAPSPTGPPSCTGSSTGQLPSCVVASSRPSRQRAVTLPNVVGSAYWPSVRPIIGVSPCRRARRSTSADRRIEPLGRQRSGTRATISIAAVSMMSWLVAPRWTCWASVAADGCAEALDEPDHRHAAELGVRRTPRRRRSVRHGTRRRSRVAAPAGMIADRRLGVGERGFDVEHRLQPRGLRGRRRRSGRGRRGGRTGALPRAVPGQIARKTDSSSPWRRMSKR